MIFSECKIGKRVIINLDNSLHVPLYITDINNKSGFIKRIWSEHGFYPIDVEINGKTYSFNPKELVEQE